MYYVIICNLILILHFVNNNKKSLLTGNDLSTICKSCMRLLDLEKGITREFNITRFVKKFVYLTYCSCTHSSNIWVASSHLAFHDHIAISRPSNARPGPVRATVQCYFNLRQYLDKQTRYTIKFTHIYPWIVQKKSKNVWLTLYLIDS